MATTWTRPPRRSSPASAGRSPGSRRTATSSAARALAAQKAAGVPRKLVGLLVEDRAVLRSHQKVIVAGVGDGEVTSGTFSPDAGALDRPRARAGADRRRLRGRDSRQAGPRARRAAAVRAPRQGRDRPLIDPTLHASTEHLHEQSSCRPALPQVARVGAPRSRRHDHHRHFRSRAAGARRPGVRRSARSGPPRATPARPVPSSNR